jgi:hypothetical protein
MPFQICSNCVECETMKTEKKKAHAIAAREKFEARHPGRMKELQKKWNAANKVRIYEEKKKKYALQKCDGLTYYQRNKAHILETQRAKYAAKKTSD